MIYLPRSFSNFFELTQVVPMHDFRVAECWYHKTSLIPQPSHMSWHLKIFFMFSLFYYFVFIFFNFFYTYMLSVFMFYFFMSLFPIFKHFLGISLYVVMCLLILLICNINFWFSIKVGCIFLFPSLFLTVSCKYTFDQFF